jgi:hypothetical protein
VNSFKVSWTFWRYRTLRYRCVLAVVFVAMIAGGASAKTCLAPSRPFVPNDPQSAQDYAEIIRRDFEAYIQEIQRYFRCLDDERARAFQEAREVSEEYGRFLGSVER